MNKKDNEQILDYQKQLIELGKMLTATEINDDKRIDSIINKLLLIKHKLNVKEV